MLEELGKFAVDPAVLHFDPDRGASGRPRAAHEFRGGPRKPGPTHTPIRTFPAGQTCVRWENGKLWIVGHNGTEHDFLCVERTDAVGAMGTAGGLGRFGAFGAYGTYGPAETGPIQGPREVAEVIWFENTPIESGNCSSRTASGTRRSAGRVLVAVAD